MIKLSVFKGVAIAIAVICLTVLSGVFSPHAIALTSITLSDLAYQDCPSEFSEGVVTPGSSLEARCFMITGKAENLSGKPVYNADVFGRVYDANNNPIMQNRSRLGSIDEVPPGVSNFELRISVPANQEPPLKLEQFKASGFAGKVRR